MQVILSFDVEEHFRIEAAVGLTTSPALQAHYRDRLDYSTRWLLDQLEETQTKATFFIVGQIARHNPGLVRSIARLGHEVASHGWAHQRLHNLTPASFREDLRRSKEALEQLTGQPIEGFRAPTFSIVRQTGWALEVLADMGMVYDSSIYPVVHDRYGIPGAPRQPFLADMAGQKLLELPIATLRFVKMKIPIGGGGYFRLLPFSFLERALRQMARDCSPPVAMLYFHPWEFDPLQARLPMGLLNRFRTYVGISSNGRRLNRLLAAHRFARAIDVAKQLDQQRASLSCFKLGSHAAIVDAKPEPVRVKPFVPWSHGAQAATASENGYGDPGSV
jgi:polysaccharide deacetylase family protein (PEP-CTERM system associated)